MPEHPNEPLLEAILLNQDKNSKDNIQMLEHLLVHADNNKLDPLLEAQLVITDKIGKDIVQAIKEIPKTEIPESKEVDFKETNKLLRELTDEVKKKEEYEVEIDSNLREKLKGDKGDSGKDGVNGKDGLNGKDGISGLDGTNGVDGKDGTEITAIEVRDKLSLLEGENRLDKSAIKGLEDLFKVVKKNSSNGLVISANGPTFDSIVRDQQISKTLTYNTDGTLLQVDDVNGSKTFNYTNGILTSILGTGLYKSKSFTYSNSQLTNVNVS